MLPGPGLLPHCNPGCAELDRVKLCRFDHAANGSQKDSAQDIYGHDEEHFWRDVHCIGESQITLKHVERPRTKYVVHVPA